MLKYLHIENIAVIEKCDIELNGGFNVFTGETGAGKSILIDSINAVLGSRTSKDLIRSGSDNAFVSAVFTDFDKKTLETLKSYDISPDEDGNVIITRKLSLNSSGYIKINSVPFTSAALKEIAPILVNIHGQHDNQDLLNRDKHINFIDNIADNSEILERYYSEFVNLKRIRKEKEALFIDESEKESKIELLKYQISEIESADIKIGEIEQLKANLKIAENKENTVKTLNFASSEILGDEISDGALTLLKSSLKKLEKLNSSEFEAICQKLNLAIEELSGAASMIEDGLYALQNGELDINYINKRLDILQKLTFKYGKTEKEILKFLENARLQLDNIVLSDEKLLKLEDELVISTNNLIALGEELTNSRKKAAKSFENDVLSVLKYLNMPNVIFKVDFKKGIYTKIGCDEIEFLISANLGEEPKPLHKIASGGELSRIMLAIKSALADSNTFGTMIFDEIDSGISGFAAEKVATQLKKVSDKRQVICVTHLAQIAAKADTHLLIEKSETNNRTFTNVSVLDYEARINEIARIMSGTELTENIYNSAKELIDRSNTYENL